MKIIESEVGFMEEEKYQKIKKIFNKNDDCFEKEELEFIYKNPGEIWANWPWKNEHLYAVLCYNKTILKTSYM